MIKPWFHLRLHTSNFYLFNFTTGNRCTFLQSTSFQLEKNPISLTLRETRSTVKKTKQVWSFTNTYEPITAVKASLIVQLLHQFQDYYTPQHISLAGSWEFSMTPTGTLWYRFKVCSFYVCNHLKNQKDDYLILRFSHHSLFSQTYLHSSV